METEVNNHASNASIENGPNQVNEQSWDICKQSVNKLTKFEEIFRSLTLQLYALQFDYIRMNWVYYRGISSAFFLISNSVENFILSLTLSLCVCVMFNARSGASVNWTQLFLALIIYAPPYTAQSGAFRHITCTFWQFKMCEVINCDNH